MASSPDTRSFLQRPGPWGTSVALLVLMAFFFILPSAFRGAREGLKNKENNIKDWLPSDFPETAELDWFADHFAGESFVLATWPGCTVGDQRLKLLEDKLLHESADFRDQILAEEESSGLTLAERRTRVRARELGVELELFPPGQALDDWGGLGEKWLASADGTWYFITPDGRLHRWEEANNGPAGLVRSVKRSLGAYKLEGKLVTALGQPSTPKKINEFYNDPSLMCAPLFETVQTGETIVKELSAEGGALWPVDLTDVEKRPMIARRRAMDRLTGSLFAPAVPPGFAWTSDEFEAVVPANRRNDLPDKIDEIVGTTLQSFADERFDGDVTKISTAITSVQTEAWYAVFDNLGVEPPARLTCLLITLTDLAKENLQFAIGRGTLGSPQGRLLALAQQSGVHPPSPPSAAPPPFNQEPPESIGGMPPLRMGGPPVDNVAIDEEGTVTLVRLIGYCVLIGVALSYFCFRSIKITIMLFMVGGSAAMLSMSMVGWTGGHVDAILLSMPSLVYVLGLSGAIHVINYYRDEVRSRGREGAAGRALHHAALPCTLAAVTTAIGLGSLYTSNLKPISNFGFYSAIGVLSTLAILFSYLPAALEVFSPSIDSRKKKKGTTGDEDSTSDASKSHDSSPSALEAELASWWASVGRVVTSNHRIVSIGCLVFLAIASLGLFKITTSVQLLKLFDANARILRDYAWLEENFGNLVPMEIIVRMPQELQRDRIVASAEAGSQETITQVANDGKKLTSNNDDPVALTLLERLEVVSRIRIVVTRTLGEEGTGEVGQASSMDTFLPPLPAVSNSFFGALGRGEFNRRVSESKEELLESDFVKIEKSGPLAGSEMWRLSLRVSALSDNDYGLFINDLRESVEPVVEAYRTRAELLKQLSAKTGKLTGKQRVLVVGASGVEDLADADLVHADGTLDAQMVYLATLKELLGNEKIKRPMWIDPNAADAKYRPGDSKWEKLIAAVDAVIWVNGVEEALVNRKGTDVSQPLAASRASEYLAAAKTVIRADQIAANPVTKRIVEIEADADKSGGRIVQTQRRVPVFDTDKAVAPQVMFTGIVPVVYKAQRTLLASLLESIMMAFVLIAAVMIVLLNPGSFPTNWMQPANFTSGLAAGSISMIPNVFPVLLVFGLMGHLRIAVDIGTMMTASVAMGVAVDDTIHFLSWFRQYLEEGKNRVEAVIATYRKVGPAMTQTTIVGGLGLFVFALSTFTPTQRFGTLMLVMLAAALIGDLILLPALLVGPLGKFFKPRNGFLRDATMEVESTWQEESATDEPLDTESSLSTGTGSVVVSQDVPILKVHTPPARKGSDRNSPKRR